jgi:hypothetical protein
MWPSLRWYLLRAGLPTGVLIALGEAINDQQVWWDVIVTIALPALALASVLAVAAEVFARRVPRSLRSKFAFVAVTTSLTIVGGLALLVLMPRLPHGHWVRLPDPPRVVRAFAGPTCLCMVGSDDGVVVMESSNGSYVVYHPQWGNSWTVESAIPPEIVRRAEGCRRMLAESATPLTFGGVVARYRIDDNGVDCGGRRHYILKSNHTVWEWSTGFCAIPWLAGGAFYLIFLVLDGLILGLNPRRTKALSSRRGTYLCSDVHNLLGPARVHTTYASR